MYTYRVVGVMWEGPHKVSLPGRRGAVLEPGYPTSPIKLVPSPHCHFVLFYYVSNSYPYLTLVYFFVVK